MDTIDTQSFSNVAFKYTCKICDYNISKKSSYDKHLLTSKHVDNSQKIQEYAKMLAKGANGSYKCICNKVFKYHSGIWRHKKTCISLDKNKPSDPITSDNSDKELIKLLIHENAEIKTLILELIKKETSNTNITNNTTNTNTNSHNKTFNLQIFLNEECKDALNLSEFVDSIKVQLSDLENFAHVDYANGISKILLKNFNNKNI